MSGFLKGFACAFAGFGLIRRHGIRLYVIIPLLVNTLLFSLVIAYGAAEVGELVDALTAEIEWLTWITWLLWPLYFLVVMTLAFFCFTVVANLLAAPFNGLLASAVERHLIGGGQAGSGPPARDAGPLPLEILREIGSELRKLAFFLPARRPCCCCF